MVDSPFNDTCLQGKVCRDQRELVVPSQNLHTSPHSTNAQRRSELWMSCRAMLGLFLGNWWPCPCNRQDWSQTGSLAGKSGELAGMTTVYCPRQLKCTTVGQVCCTPTQRRQMSSVTWSLHSQCIMMQLLVHSFSEKGKNMKAGLTKSVTYAPDKTRPLEFSNYPKKQPSQASTPPAASVHKLSDVGIH